MFLAIAVVFGVSAPAASVARPAAAAASPVATVAVPNELVAFTPVYECTIDGRWWATKATCQQHCGGGSCFVCGVDCQN